MSVYQALKYLPENISKAIMSMKSEQKDEICEIRFRRNMPFSLTTQSRNLFINSFGKTVKIDEGIRCTPREIELVVNRLCEGSVYRYMNTINQGYIVTPCGLRAGICGECTGSGESVQNFTSVNIRIPRIIENIADTAAIQFLEKGGSYLIFSPPGEGKTTYLRSLVMTLASGKLGKAKRVAVVDERWEILPPVDKINNFPGIIDRLCGYSKHKGMEIATRLMSPELIVCDEIGISDDLDAILSVQNSGVPLIATTHGKNIEALMQRPIIKRLLEKGVFDYLIGLKREKNIISTSFHQLTQNLYGTVSI